MHPLQAAVVIITDRVSLAVPASATASVGLGELVHALVRDIDTFDQTNPLQLGQGCQLHDGLVCQMLTASQIDITDSAAALHQALDRIIRDVAAVAKVYVVKILTQAWDGIDRGVRDVATLGEDEVSKARGHVDDLLHGSVGETHAACQVEDPEVFEDPARWQSQESMVINQVAVSKAKLPKGLALGKEGVDGLIADVATRVQIDLEDVRAVIGEGQNGVIIQLIAVIQFKLGRAGG
jgi:hypothetical protein